MSDELIERVAREIAEEADADTPWDDYAASEQQNFRRRANRILALSRSNDAVRLKNAIAASTRHSVACDKGRWTVAFGFADGEDASEFFDALVAVESLSLPDTTPGVDRG